MFRKSFIYPRRDLKKEHFYLIMMTYVSHNNEILSCYYKIILHLVLCSIVINDYISLEIEAVELSCKVDPAFFPVCSNISSCKTPGFYL